MFRFVQTETVTVPVRVTEQMGVPPEEVSAEVVESRGAAEVLFLA